ncbi:unnamed protein product, partial [Prorocentrum cordatum]
MADSQRRFCHPPPPPPPAHGCRQPAAVEQLEQAPVKQLPRWERLRLAVEAQQTAKEQFDKQVTPQVEAPVVSPFSPQLGVSSSSPIQAATEEPALLPKAMEEDTLDYSVAQGATTSTSTPTAPRKRRRKHMLNDYKSILKRLKEESPAGQEPDMAYVAAMAMGWIANPTDATSEALIFYIGDGDFPDAGGEGVAPDMSALSGGVSQEGSGMSADSGGAL